VCDVAADPHQVDGLLVGAQCWLHVADVLQACSGVVCKVSTSNCQLLLTDPYMVIHNPAGRHAQSKGIHNMIVRL